MWWAAYAREATVGTDSRPLGHWNPAIEGKHVLLADFDFDGRLDLAGLATQEPAAQSGGWWVERSTAGGLENAAWGVLRLADGLSIRRATSSG